MLHLILGRAGTGKTTCIQEEIAKRLAAGKTVYLIVPEQFSFETEKNLVSSLCGPQFFRLQVVSFTRLAQLVFEKHGGQPSDLLDEGGRCLLAAKAAISCADLLGVYGDNCLSPGFLRNLMSLFDTAGSAAVTPHDLEAAAAHLPESAALRMKDLSGLYAVYLGLMEESRLDAAHLVGRAARLAEEQHFFADSEAFLDGFDGFSGAQMTMLQVLLTQCDQMTVALCTNDLSGSGSAAFAAPAKTAADLRAMAAHCQVPTAQPVILEQPHRFEAAALQAVETHFLSGEPEKKTLLAKGAVRLIRATDVYEQAEGVCALIADAVRQKGLRYRDIVVITRNLSANRDIFAAAFETYEIPLFLDRREKVSGTPLFLFLSGALAAVQYRWRTEDMLRLAKSGAFGFDRLDLSELENYCYIWQVQSSAWKTPFVANPDGLNAPRTPENDALLEKLEQMRQTLVQPLEAFAANAASCTGVQFATSLVTLCKEVSCYAHLLNDAKALQQMGETDLAARFSQVWECFVTLCDRLATVFEDTVLPLDRWIRLFDLLKEQYDVGQLPTTIDSVLIGDAQRIRADNRKLCIITDFSRGLFPLEETGKSGLLTKKDLRALDALGVHLGDLEEEQARREDFYAYTALTCAAKQLIVMTPAADRKYTPTRPSRYLTELTGLFSDLTAETVSSFPPAMTAVTSRALFCQAARHAGENTPVFAALHALLPGNEQEQLTAIRAKQPFALKDRHTAQQLFGKRMRLSASRVDGYYQCPFSYFLQYALRLRERKKAEFAPLESGSLIHFVLEQVLKTTTPTQLLSLSDAQLLACVREQMESFLSGDKALAGLLTPRQKGQLTRIAKALTAMLRRLAEEFAQSSFAPADFELPIGCSNTDTTIPLEPLVLETPNGATVQVEGVVDRVDVCKRKGITYLRVVDYKSGGKEFRLQDIYHGLNLQMLLYLFVLWEKGKKRYDNPIPAGVLYFPAKADAVAVDRNESTEKWEDKAKKRFRMDGLLLDDPDLIEAMEPGAQGVFLPVSRKSSGALSPEGSLAALSELGMLYHHTNRLLANMADSLLQGKIPAMPAQDRQNNPCIYCRYAAVCRRESCDPARVLQPMTRSEIFDRLDETNVTSAGNEKPDPDNPQIHEREVW